MTEETLMFIDNGLVAAGINYMLGEWTADKVYPYWVGEYQEIEPTNEDGMQESTFILTGFARSSDQGEARELLEKDKTKIKQLFNSISGLSTITDTTGSAVVVFYSNALSNIPTGDAELKKIQINLNVKEWSVN